MRSALAPIVRNKAPVPFVPTLAPTMARIFTRTDRRSQLEAYTTVSTFMATINRRASDASKVPWTVFQTRDGRGRITPAGQVDRVEKPDHEALQIWRNPNPFFTGKLLRKTILQHVDLAGDAFLILAEPDQPFGLIELWPVRPDRMEPVPHPTEFLLGWVYTAPDGLKVPLDRDQVIQLKPIPDPLDPYRGVPPTKALLTDLDSYRFASEWMRNFFLKSAVPLGIIEVSRRLGDDEFKELRERWAEQHQGVANAHRTAILEHGEYKSIGFSMRDMQFKDLRNEQRDAIREAYGMSKILLGQTENVNRATAEAAEYIYTRYPLSDLLTELKEMANEQLLPLLGFDSGVEFDHANVVPANVESDNADRDSRVQSAVSLKNAGYDPAESLEAMGLPPITFVGRPGTGEVNEGEPSNTAALPNGEIKGGAASGSNGVVHDRAALAQPVG